MKKILAVLMAIIMLATGTTFAYAAYDTPPTTQLQFNKNGKFKILILADIQDGYPIEPSTPVIIEETLERAKPDLVVLLGDNLMGSSDKTIENYKKGFDIVLAPIVERGIPFTLVNGNHDDETMPQLTIEQILEIYQEYDGCLAYDAVPSLHGCANHNLEILSSDGSHTAFNLWMLDSGAYMFDEEGNKTHYDCVRKDQIEWYKETSKALEEKNGAPVPSFVFQHMVPQEVAKQVMVNVPFHLGDWAHFDLDDGTAVTYLPNIFGFFGGIVGEAPSPSPECEGEWDAFVERGDVLAAFFGHDHRNTFRARVKGIDGVNVPGCTYQAYYSKVHQGSTLLTLDERDLSTYKLENIYSNELALAKDSKLPGLDRSKSEYFWTFVLNTLIRVVLGPLKEIANKVGTVIYG